LCAHPAQQVEGGGFAQVDNAFRKLPVNHSRSSSARVSIISGIL
jgi:hypothetical protein